MADLPSASSRDRTVAIVADDDAAMGMTYARIAVRPTRDPRPQALSTEPDTTAAFAVDRLCAGGLVILHDDERDQGDLIAWAGATTPAVVNVMARMARGLVSVVLTPERVRDLGLRSLPARHSEDRPAGERVPTMASVEARHGVSTGISAADRARTIAVLASGDAAPEDLVSPGHVFPLVAAAGGLMERSGRLEAALDALRLGHLDPAATICDVLNANGDLARADELVVLAAELDVPLVTVSALREMRLEEVWGGLADGIPLAPGTAARTGDPVMPATFGLHGVTGV
jgi:3,4-dihydroxy-2-butanone 4-phosphate synthase